MCIVEGYSVKLLDLIIYLFFFFVFGSLSTEIGGNYLLL